MSSARLRTTPRAVAGPAALLLAALLLAACASGGHPKPGAGESAAVARGQYLVTIMDCGGCHTPGALAGQPDVERPLAGSRIGFAHPGGIVYPPNLTADPETGLGRWTDEAILRAIRRGQSRDGRHLIPIMPWPSSAVLTDADARALVAYLRTVRPVRAPIPLPVPAGAAAPYLTVVEPR